MSDWRLHVLSSSISLVNLINISVMNGVVSEGAVGC